LVEVDKENKIAVFDAKWQEKGPWDPVLKDFEAITKREKLKKFRKLSPEQKKRIRKQKNWFKHLPKEQRKGLRIYFKSMSIEERKETRQRLRKMSSKQRQLFIEQLTKNN
jgi:hypothetical protein